MGRLSHRRLSGKLLLMTIGFVMLAELVIFVPSAALYRQTWLEERISQVDIVNLALVEVEGFKASEELTKRFIIDSDIIMGSERHEGMSKLLFGAPPETNVPMEIIDVREHTGVPKFRDAFMTFFGRGEGYYRVIGDASFPKGGTIELIVSCENLQGALRDYFKRIFFLSLAIAIITGSLIYFTMAFMIIRPVQTLARNVTRFQQNPEIARPDSKISERVDEIGDLERAFFDMQQGIRTSLKQKQRLATLGLAVAKINHDLRNVLTSAQLVSDRLSMDPDPKVSRMGERLTRAIDRGVKMTRDVLNFSSPEADPMKREPIRISFLLGEVAGDVLPAFGTGARKISFMNDVPSDLQIDADPDHTYRIFHNLMRNAAQAMAALIDDNEKRHLRVYADISDSDLEIYVSDSAGGLPGKAKKNLFKAFASGGGKGSTGLGLTIAKELATDQGGDLRLERTNDTGTVFTVTLKKFETKKS
ncbi:MAG: HAMP domain-containing sensor histidine kinase [Maricaulaceae bacterium]